MPLSRGLLTRFLAAGIAAVAVGGIVSGCGSGGGGSGLEGAGSDWSTNGGTMSNQRYSTLDEIDTSNVAQLKGVWRTHLTAPGVAAKYSAREPADRPERRDLHHHREQRRLRGLGGQREDPLGAQVGHQPGDLDDLLRLAEPRRRDRRRSSSTSGSSTARSSRSTRDRQRDLDEAARQVAEGPDDHRRAALPRREDLHRHRRARSTARAAFLEAIDAGTGEQRLALVHESGPGRPGRRHLAAGLQCVPARRRHDLAAPAVDEELGLLYFSTGNAGSDWFGGDRAGQQPLRGLDRRDRPRDRAS